MTKDDLPKGAAATIEELREALKVQRQEELQIFAIWDKKSEKYDTPFFAYNDIFAKRRFLIMQSEKKSPLAMWPEDFELHRIGNFNITDAGLKNDNEVLNIQE